LDFTIDKKLEQDLWNFVFKSQINNLQSRIKEASPSIGTNDQQQQQQQQQQQLNSDIKRLEAQAKFSFYLESARGFYLRLLDNIVTNFNDSTSSNDKIKVPFCRAYRFHSFFNQINNSKPLETIESSSIEVTAKNDKKFLYICQHILTHLGDICRYENNFIESRNFYLHAITLIPYLGQPYNQLAILCDTTRMHQLATVFYYVRSIAVKYTFPIATTNLDSLFDKLVDIPLQRYNPSVTLSLATKDLILIYLQINAIIYKILNETSDDSSSSSKVINQKLLKNKTRNHHYHQRLETFSNRNNLKQFINIFISSFKCCMSDQIQRNKFDNIHLLQMITILLFVLDKGSLSVKLTQNELVNNTYNDATTLFIDLLEILIETWLNITTTTTTTTTTEVILLFDFILLN
jgi:hypothetical protein